MKVKRLLFLVMAICLASGVKAQFYDSADEIYYYVEYKDGDFVTTPKADVMIFNFDGRKAALLNRDASLGYIPPIAQYSDVCKNTGRSINYYEERVENVSYDVYYDSNKRAYYLEFKSEMGRDILTGASDYMYYEYEFTFSSNREMCYMKVSQRNPPYNGFNSSWTKTLKKVSKNYFKSGRSRTPSGTMYE